MNLNIIPVFHSGELNQITEIVNHDYQLATQTYEKIVQLIKLPVICNICQYQEYKNYQVSCSKVER